ncbi:MAG: hypothetical protein ACPGYX_06505, partial [Oceanobacter sp.]
MPIISDSLISPNLLRAAGLETAENAGRRSASNTFEVQVSQSDKTANGQFRITVTDGQRQLQVQSEQPLPAGTRLTLALKQGPNGQTELEVLQTRPPQNSAQATGSTSAQTIPVSKSLQNWIDSRLTIAQTSALIRQPGGDLASASANNQANNPASTSSTLATVAQSQTPSNAINSTHSAIHKTGYNLSTGNQANRTYTPFSNLGTLLPLLKEQTAAPDSDIGRTLKRLAEAIPALNQLQSSQRIRSSLEHSGMFFERKLVGALNELALQASATMAATTTKTTTTSATNQTANLAPNVSTHSGSGLSTRTEPRPQPSHFQGNQSANLINKAQSASSAEPGQNRLLAMLNRLSRSEQTVQSLNLGLNPTSSAGIQTNPQISVTPSSESPLTGLVQSVATEQTQSPLQQLINKDTKGLLLKLATQIRAELEANTLPASNGRSTSSEALVNQNTSRLLQAALADIELEQTRAHPSTQTLTQALTQATKDSSSEWNLPLLYQHNDQLQKANLHIERSLEDEHTLEENKPKTRWTLNLHFDLEEAGPLDISVALNWPAVSATFWSEHADV